LIGTAAATCSTKSKRSWASGQHLLADLLHQVLVLTHRAERERRRHQAAEVGMRRRVGVDHGAPRFQGVGRQVLQRAGADL
jgi:hypothetical protein